MDLNASVLGADTVRELQERKTNVILQIGSDRFSRRDLAKVECYNFMAAQNLSNVLNANLKVPNLRYVFDKVNPAELALPRLGAFSLAVLAAAFEAKGIGGDAPLENYLKKHKLHVQTFNTIKINELHEQSEEKKRLRERRRSRRNKAHELRVGRFTERKTNGNGAAHP